MARMVLLELLQAAMERDASDILLAGGAPVLLRQDGVLVAANGGEKLSVQDMLEYQKEILAEAAKPDPRSYPCNFSWSVPDFGRVRTCVYKQRGSIAIVMRVITYSAPTVESLDIPGRVADLTELPSGLVLIGGSAGSGRTSTVAALVDRINHTRPVHVLSISETLEYLHKNDRGLVTQVEYMQDTNQLNSILDSVLRQSVDVLVVDAAWDIDTRRILRMAAAGKLVFLVTHGTDEKSVLQFFVDLLPAEWREAGLSLTQQVLKAIVVQDRLQLDGGGQTVAWGVFTGRLGFQTCEELRAARACEFSGTNTREDQGWLLGEMLAAMAHERVMSKDQFRRVCADADVYEDLLRRRYEEEKPNPLYAVVHEREMRKGVQSCEI